MFWTRLLISLAEFGLSILLSSHLLVEIDELVDRLLVLNEGEALFYGSPTELRAGNEKLHIRVDAPERASSLLSSRGFDVTLDGDHGIKLSAATLTLENARSILKSKGLVLHGFHRENQTLEEALLERLQSRASTPEEKLT